MDNQLSKLTPEFSNNAKLNKANQESYFVAGFMEFDPRHAAGQAHRAKNQTSRARPQPQKNSWFKF
jgi:hypothetical protein